MAGDLVSFLSAAGDEILILIHLFLHSSQTSQAPSAPSLPSVSSLSTPAVPPSSHSHLSHHSFLPSSSLDRQSFSPASPFTTLCPLTPLSLASRPLLRLLSDASAASWTLTLPLPHFFLPSSVAAFCPSAAAGALAPASQLSLVSPPLSSKRHWEEGDTEAAAARPQGEEGQGRRGAVSSPARPKGWRQQPGNLPSTGDTKECEDFVDRHREDPGGEEANDGDRCRRSPGVRPPDRSTQTDYSPANQVGVYVYLREAAASAASAARAQSPVARLAVADVDRTSATRQRGETESERLSSRPPSSVLVAFEHPAGTPGTGVRTPYTPYSLCCYVRNLEFHWRRFSRRAGAFPMHANACRSRPLSEYFSSRKKEDSRRLPKNGHPRERTRSTEIPERVQSRAPPPDASLLLSSSGTWLVLVLTNSVAHPLLSLWRLPSSSSSLSTSSPSLSPSSSSLSSAAGCGSSESLVSLQTPRLDRVSALWRREETEAFRAECEDPVLVAYSSLPLHASSCGGKPADEDVPRREQRDRAALCATIESEHCPPLLCLGETRLVLHRGTKVSLFRLPSLSIVSELFPPFVASASAADFLSLSLSAAPTASRSSSPPPRRLESVVFLLGWCAPQRGRDSLCWFRLDLYSARDGRQVLLAVPPRGGVKTASPFSPFAASDAQPLPSNAFSSERNGEDEEAQREICESLKLAGQLPSSWHLWSNDQFIVAMQRHCYQTPRPNAPAEEEEEREEESEEEEAFAEEPREVAARGGEESVWRRATEQEQREMKIRKKRLYTVVFWRIHGLYRHRRGGKTEQPPTPDAPDRLLRLRDGRKSNVDKGGRHRELKELTRAEQEEDRGREEEGDNREQAGERKEAAGEETAEREEEDRLLMVLGRKQYRIAGRWGCAVGALVEDLLLWSPSESLELHITRLAREKRQQSSSSLPRDSRRAENATDWHTNLEALPGLAAEFGGFSALAVSPVAPLHPLPPLALPDFGASPVAKERKRRSSLSSESRRATTDDWASSHSPSSDSDATDFSVLSASLFSSPSSSPSSSLASTPKADVSSSGSLTLPAQSPHPVHRSSSTRSSSSPSAVSSSVACASPASTSWSPSSSVSVVSPRTLLVAVGCSAGALLVGMLHRTPRPHKNSPARQPVGHRQAPFLYSSPSSSSPSTSSSCVYAEGGQRNVSRAPWHAPAQGACSRFRGSGEVGEEESEFSFEVLWCINGECMDGWRVDSLALFLDAGILVATHDFSRAFDLRSGVCLSQFPAPAFRFSDAALRCAEARDSPAEQSTEDREPAGGNRRNTCRDRREGDRGREREDGGGERGNSGRGRAGETVPVAATVGGGGRRIVYLSINREASERHAGHVDYVLESVDFAPPSSAPLPCELLSPSSSAADSSLSPWKEDHETPETAVGDARDRPGVHTAEDCTRWWRSCRGCRAAPGNLREAETGELFCSPLCFEASQCTCAGDSKADTTRSCAAETSPLV
ncbi:hypothetical protein TGARI_232320 [Toxoplasma gondii ARI]|uniref:Uncharacterized protein n=1 Tax=Toxoplasma gondii ARI TaxID=1074872 RepID=A0A139Y5G9_TOXGO|nr:hypothetical protein TGARI_232320 [Toxoplasma gondii ARI]